MTQVDALVELDQLFDAFLDQQVAQMQAANFSKALIDALLAEYRIRYAERRDNAAAWAAGDNTADLHLAIPEGTA